MTTKKTKGVKRVMRAAILCSASTLAVMAGGAYAQDAAPAGTEAGDVETVIVTGVRGSLQRAMNIKKNSYGVVDAISSEDIGKYPDANLAESVQRIPGVSINRINGEGSEVTVRGFGPSFNQVTLNGRQMPTANIAVVGTDTGDFAGGGTRNFDFANIASDGVSGLEVYKTGRAGQPSGGLGATLNIKTLRPLDRAGSTGSLTVKGVQGGEEDWTPEVSGAYNWSNEDRTFGVSLFGSVAEREIATRSSTQNAWNLEYGSQFYAIASGRLRYGPAVNGVRPLLTDITNAPGPDDLVTYPNDSRYHFSENESTRTNIQGTVQWRPAENWLFTVDALYAENEVQEIRNDQTNWFNRPFDEIIFEQGPSGIYTAVYLSETLSGVKDVGFEQQLRATKDTLSSFGVNARWDISDTMHVTFDLSTSKGEALPNNRDGSSSVMASMGAPVISSHSVDFRGTVPIQRYTINDGMPVYQQDADGNNVLDGNGNPILIGYRGNNNGVLDLGDLGSQVFRTATNSQTHKIDQARVDFTYEIFGESRMDFGAAFTKSSMETTTGQTYQALGDWGISNPGDVEQYAGDLVTAFNIGDLFNEFDVGDSTIAFRGNALDIYEAMAAGYGVTIPAASTTANIIDEDTLALYGQFSMKSELVGFPVSIVAGLRYEKTDVKASALQSVPTAIVWNSDNDFAQQFGGGIATLSQNADYDNWLPNVDIAVNITDDIIVRASYSKTIARQNFSALYATTTVNNPGRPTLNGTPPTATIGNPALLPYESSNIDFSAEWYYGSSNYVSLGFYNKDVANFLGRLQVSQNFFDLRDPTSGAPGSRSGIANEALTDIGQSPTDVNLFTMTALVIKNNGNVAAATAEFQANLVGADLNQAFVDQILAQYDITADSNDPLFMFLTDTQINAETANIHGFEMAFQHFFGDTGFGVSGSLTTVSGDVEFDNSAPPGTQQFALPGLSDTYNISLIYDKGPLSGRLTYNWRDTFLNNTGRDGAANNPTYIEEFGTLDASVNYQVTPSFQLSFEGLNLTKEYLRSHGRDPAAFYFGQELDTRYQIGLRYKF